MYKKRYRRRKMRTTLRRMGKISTDALMVKLTLQHSVFPTGNTAPNVSFKLNSAFEPLITGAPGDAQPIGYDQWAQLYRNYQVMGSALYLTCINNLNTSGFNIAVYPSSQAIEKPDYATASQTKYSTTRFVSSRGGGRPRIVIKKYMTPQKLQGRQTNDDDWAALVDEDPLTLLYWHIRAEDSLATHLNIEAMWQFQLTFYVRFYNRIEVGEIPAPP